MTSRQIETSGNTSNREHPVSTELQIAYVPIASLKPNPRNARTHSQRQVRQIAASIREFNWTSPIIVDGHNVIIAGQASQDWRQEIDGGTERNWRLKRRQRLEGEPRGKARAQQRLEDRDGARHAAATGWHDHRGHHGSNRLAATLGPRLLCWRYQKALGSESNLNQDRRGARLSDDGGWRRRASGEPRACAPGERSWLTPCASCTTKAPPRLRRDCPPRSRICAVSASRNCGTAGKA